MISSIFSPAKMKQSVLMGVSVGFLILLAANLVWISAYRFEILNMPLMALLSWSPMIAALVASVLAPNGRALTGMLMAPIGAAFSALASFAYPLAGVPTDFPGARGAPAAFWLALVTNCILCAIGTGVGYGLVRLMVGRPPSHAARPRSGHGSPVASHRGRSPKG